MKARKCSIVRVGGVGALIDGYDKDASYKFGTFFKRGQVFKIEFIDKSGDYDWYRVIYS